MFNVLKSVCCGWLLLFIIISNSIAQPYSISGSIKNLDSGEPLSYATLKIKNSNIGSISNVDGFFTLLNVPGDSVVLVCSYIGFKTLEIPLLITENSKMIIELESAIAQLDEVIITAESFQLMKTSEGLSQTRLSPKDIVLLPNIGEVDIFRSLQLLPGVSATNENSSGLFIRGGTPDQNLVLYDGMTVYHVDHFFGFFSAFNADAIKDVNLYKGAYPARYGGRISGVVDLTGKTGDVNNFNLEAGINLLSFRGLVEIPLWGKGSILIAGRRSFSDFLESKLYQRIFNVVSQTNDPSQLTPNNQIEFDLNSFTPISHFYDLNTKITFRPTDRDNLSFSFYNGEDFLDESREFSRDLDFGGQAQVRIDIDIDDETNWGNQGMSFKWSRQWNPKFYSNALGAYSNYFSDYDRLARLDIVNPSNNDTILFSGSLTVFEKNRIDDYTFSIDNEWLLNASHKFDFGFLWKKYDLSYEFILNDTTTILDREQEAMEGSLYFQDTWKLTNKLTLNLGLRGAYYDLTDQYFFEPRASAEYKVSTRFKIKAGYGRFNQFVNRIINENVTEGSRDFWLLSDGEILEVNSATHYVVGGSYEIDKWLFDVEMFRKDITGLSEFSLRFQRSFDDDASQLFFRGSGKANGIEFMVQKKIGKYSGWAAYTISRIEHTFPNLNDGNPFPALHDQSHEIKTVHNLSLGEWNLSATWVYGSGQPFTQPESTYNLNLLDGNQLSYIHVGLKNGERLPPYHRLDISAHFRTKIGKSKLDFGLSLFNFYNHKNTWYKEFDVSETPILVTDINFLSFTPNLSVNFKL